MLVKVRKWGETKVAGTPTTIFEITLQNPLPVAGRPLNLMFAGSREDLDAIRKAIEPARLDELAAGPARIV